MARKGYLNSYVNATEEGSMVKTQPGYTKECKQKVVIFVEASHKRRPASSGDPRVAVGS